MPRKYLEVFYTVENGGKTYWHRCGVAFENQDGSLNVHLEAFPVSGKLHIREPKEK